MDCPEELRKTLKQLKGKNEEGSKHKAYVEYLIRVSAGEIGNKLMGWESAETTHTVAFKHHICLCI